MPNRIIKESIHESERLNQITDFQFRLWVSLMVYVDDYGRGDARPAIVRGNCLPLRDTLDNDTLQRELQALADAGCIELYQVNGRPYLCFPTWEKHQNVRSKRSKYPAPEPRGADAPDSSEKEPEGPPRNASRAEPFEEETTCNAEPLPEEEASSEATGPETPSGEDAHEAAAGQTGDAEDATMQPEASEGTCMQMISPDGNCSRYPILSGSVSGSISVSGTYSAELPAGGASPPKEDHSDFSIPLNNGTRYNVPLADIAEYRSLYPAVDVEQQLRAMIGWSLANPRHRKTPGGIKRFINSWLAREQDKGGSRHERDRQHNEIAPGGARYGTVL